jgi:general secretion pathway protein B
MSYILDALKKADRERHLAKVPTLTTVHIPVYVTRQRVVVWAVAAVLLGSGLFVWFWPAWSRRTASAPVGSAATGGVASPVGGAPPRHSPASPITTSSPPPVASGDRLLPRPSGVSPQEGLRRPGMPSSRPSQSGPAPTPKPLRPLVETHPSELEAAEPGPSPTSLRPEILPRAEAVQRQMDRATVAPPSAPAALATLRDALPRMTLDVFVYTDVEAERMAVINGHRYVKGQSVDGLYLVEAIIPEGVVLSYQGEQAVLRP